ncbi:MAG: hypothetical protein AAF598_06200, partial [Bacteroidota bacterium]
LGFAERMEEVLLQVLQAPTAAKLVTQEIATFYYAFLSWKKPMELPEGVPYFTSYKRTGYWSVLIAIAFVALVELFAMHLLIQQWSETAAWIVSILSVYGYIFLLGDAAALIKRPSFLTASALHFRLGFRWKAIIPLDQIQAVLPIKRLDKTTMLDLSLLNSPKYLIQLRKPITVVGIFGIKRTHDQLAIDADWDFDEWNRKLVATIQESEE